MTKDMTATMDLTLEKGTGPKRDHRPVYVSLLPPCSEACPAGEDIQAWLAHAQAGRLELAWQKLMEANPFPAIHGRVCYHPCETACNRGALDESVSVHAVERFLGDLAIERGWQMPQALPTNRRVLVVGAGPSGLSAAYHLRRLGHEVEVQDAAPEPGGMMHFGIPAYRLPRDVLLREITQLEHMGIIFTPDCKVVDLKAAMESGAFDAAFVAIGMQIGKRIDIPAMDAARVLTAVGLLGAVEAGKAPKLGRRVAIYGAGNTAMDAARTAKRLGAEEATIVFFSDRAHMEALPFEAAEAEAEGITLRWLSSIRAMGEDAIKIEVMALDAAGIPQPTGAFETLAADSLVLALGQAADSGFLETLPGIAFGKDGALVVDADMMTGAAGVFAGGDVVPGKRTVTAAVGQGRHAANSINLWLQGAKPRVHEPRRVVSFDMLNLPMFTDAKRAEQVEAPVAKRITGFGEIIAGLDEKAAQREAKRCLSCGNCFECDKCYAACPEDAILKLGPGRGFGIVMALCTGCAVCVEQCPCHAMEMIPEPPRETNSFSNGQIEVM